MDSRLILLGFYRFYVNFLGFLWILSWFRSKPQQNYDEHKDYVKQKSYDDHKNYDWANADDSNEREAPQKDEEVPQDKSPKLTESVIYDQLDIMKILGCYGQDLH